MNLDERISNLRLYQYVLEDYGSVSSETEDEIKQLIRDVLEYAKPDRPGVSKDSADPLENKLLGFSLAIDDMEAKQQELGL